VTSTNRTAVGALVVAEIVSVLGTRMTYLALPWFVLVTTGSPGKMSAVLAAEILPMALLGIPSGMLVEKLGGRTTMLVCDLARAPIMASIPLLHSMDALSFPLLLGLVALLGSFMPPYFAAQRVVLPELVGEDERLISQGSSMIEGGMAFSALLGPALAGLLIPFIGAPNVLYVDAATFLVSFVLLLTLVPRRKPLRAPTQRGLLAGLRFVVRDGLLGPLTATVAGFGFVVTALSASLAVFAYDHFESSRIAGLFFAALGAGALVGTVCAVFIVKRIAPLRLAAFGILAFAVPLWVLPLTSNAWLVMLALFVATLFTPLVNGPIMGVLTARTPEALRPKVMTAIVSLHTVAAPLGFLAAGQILERWGVDPVFFGVAASVTLLSLVFATIALRHRDEDPVDLSEVPQPVQA
jgi:predicted MFS family arabinose efflux permease